MRQKRKSEHVFEDILFDGNRSIDGRRYRLKAYRVKHELRKFSTA